MLNSWGTSKFVDTSISHLQVFSFPNALGISPWCPLLTSATLDGNCGAVWTFSPHVLGFATCCMCQPFWRDVLSSTVRMVQHTGCRISSVWKYLTKSLHSANDSWHSLNVLINTIHTLPRWLLQGLKIRQPKQNLPLRTPLTTSSDLLDRWVCWGETQTKK